MIDYSRKPEESAANGQRRLLLLKLFRSTFSGGSRRRSCNCLEQLSLIQSTTTRNSAENHEGAGGHADLVLGLTTTRSFRAFCGTFSSRHTDRGWPRCSARSYSSGIVIWH